MTADALVLGGGLAGCAAAITLACAGRDVVLVEREASPKHKVCGEFLSGEALTYLQHLGVDLPMLGAVPIHHVRFAGHRAAKLPFPAMSLSRLALDESLLKLACAAGVRVLRGCAVQALTPDGAALSNGDCLESETVFVATGKHDLPGHPRPLGPQGDLLAMKMYWQFSLRETAAMAGHVELIVYRGGYAGLQPVEAGTANLCCLVERDTFRKLGGCWEALLAHMKGDSPALAQRLQDAEPLLQRPLAISSIPYGYVRARTDGFWYLGDQAAVIPSFTGDGMSMALHSGLLAARMHLEGASAAAFHRRIETDLGGCVARATWLSLAMVRHPRLVTAAVRLWPGALRTVAAATRIPERSMLVRQEMFAQKAIPRYD